MAEPHKVGNQDDIAASVDDRLDMVEDTVDIAVEVAEEVDIPDSTAEDTAGREEEVEEGTVDMDFVDIEDIDYAPQPDNAGREVVKTGDLVTNKRLEEEAEQPVEDKGLLTQKCLECYKAD